MLVVPHQPGDEEDVESGQCLCFAVDPGPCSPGLLSRDEESKGDWRSGLEPQAAHSQSSRPHSAPSVIWVVAEVAIPASGPAI